jgi:hypothetical protein
MCAKIPETAPIDGGDPRSGAPTAAPPASPRPGTGIFLRVMGMPCYIHVIQHKDLRGPGDRAEDALSAP